MTIQNQAAAAISCNQQMQATTQQRMQRYEKQVSLVTFLLHKTKADSDTTACPTTTGII